MECLRNLEPDSEVRDGRLAATELACAILIEHLDSDDIKAELTKRLDCVTRVEIGPLPLDRVLKNA